MDQNSYENTQPYPPRRRRKRTKMQDFKEAYLPVIILALTVILVLIFIIGSASRPDVDDSSETTPPTQPTDDQTDRLKMEADALIDEAKRLAEIYDYTGAMDTLVSFSGDMNTIPGMVELYNQYSMELAKLVPYTDMEHITHLSVNMLIGDLNRALADPDYGSRFNRNYITTGEFKKVLQALYDADYMLVSLYDVAEKTVSANGSVTVTPGKLYLPEGKKPLILTQTAPNYFSYIVDSDKDGVVTHDNAGFASRLVLDANGELTCEMVDTDGKVIYGAYDLIPILNDFVEEHPDFSYKGAKATIALTGYDGLFGYRTDPETAEKISQDFYNQQINDVRPIIDAVRAAGYDIACYSYDHTSYGEMSSEAIAEDLALWQAEVTPLLGEVDILVYPNGSDIMGTGEYSGDKYEVLKEFGFTYFIGQDSAIPAWGQLTDSYFRQTRRQLNPALMAYSYSYFEDLFYAPEMLDASRGEIPY